MVDRLSVFPYVCLLPTYLPPICLQPLLCLSNADLSILLSPTCLQPLRCLSTADLSTADLTTAFDLSVYFRPQVNPSNNYFLCLSTAYLSTPDLSTVTSLLSVYCRPVYRRPFYSLCSFCLLPTCLPPTCPTTTLCCLSSA